MKREREREDGWRGEERFPRYRDESLAPSTHGFLHPQLQETVEQMKIALTRMIEDAQMAPSASRNAFDGVLLLAQGGRYTYQCRLHALWALEENTRISVQPHPDMPTRIDARVVSVLETTLVLVTREPISDEHLKHFVLLEDMVWLLERQREVLTFHFRETKAELGAKVFGYLPCTSGTFPVPGPLGPFRPNEQQQQALELALGSERILIVGPGGTGKSVVLSALTNSCLKMGFSVLTVSHTNIATDNLFLRQMQAVEESGDEDLQDLLAQGYLARAGDPRHRSLLTGPYCTLTVDAIAQQRADVTAESMVQVEQKQQELKKKSEDREKTLTLQERKWGRKRARLQKSIKSLHEQQVTLETDARQQPTLVSVTETLASVRHSRKGVEEKMQVGEAALEQLRMDLKEVNDEFAETQRHLEELKDRLAEIKKEVVSHARLITTTVSSAFLNPQLLGRTFDVVLVDEISMIPLVGLLLVVSHAEKKVIVAGDPMQLAPILKTTCAEQERQQKMLEAVKWLGQDLLTYLGVTMEDAITGSKGSVLLKEQGRTHPIILAPLNHFVYQGMLTSRNETKVAPPFGPLPECPLLLVDTSQSNAKAYRHPAGSRMNEHHIKVVLALVRQIKATLPQRSLVTDASVPRIGVLTPYRLQARRIAKALRDVGLEGDVHVGTINTAQALEFEVTILDTVDAPGVTLSKFTCDTILDKNNMATGATRLWTVGHSRAKHKLIYIAHADYLCGKPLHRAEKGPSKQCLLVELVKWTAREGYMNSTDVLHPSLMEEM